MDTFVVLVQQVPVYMTALVGVLTALIGLFMLVPGDEPEKALQKIVDFLAKFSRK